MSDKETWGNPGEHVISAEDFPQWAAERLALQDKLLAAVMGKTKAMEVALFVLTSAHPNPEELREQWERLRPELVDDEMDKQIYKATEYRDGYQKTFASIANVLDAAIAMRRDEPPRTE